MAFLGFGSSEDNRERMMIAAYYQQQQLQQQLQQQAQIAQQAEAKRVADAAEASRVAEEQRIAGIRAQEAEMARQAAARTAPVAPTVDPTKAAATVAQVPDIVAPAKNKTFADYQPFLNQRLALEGIGSDNPAYNEITNFFTGRVNEELSRDPSGLGFDPSTLYGETYNTLAEAQKRRYNAQLDTQLPSGFERTAFADTADDAVLDSILNSQRGTARSAVDTARSRGQLNDAGFAAALKGLDDAYTTGRSQAQEIGSGVLDRYRSALSTASSGLRDRANASSYGVNFDLAGGINDIRNRASGYASSLEGDIRSAIGERNFFDTNTLLGKAGTAQGFVNPGVKVGVPNDALTQTFIQNAEEKARRVQPNVGVF